jgi:hypothetical protein
MLNQHVVRKLICKEKPMLELSHIDPRSAALLVMDYQVDTLTRFMTAAQSETRAWPWLTPQDPSSS